MPLKTNLHYDTSRYIYYLTCAFNSTPKKSLRFKTPAEAFFHKLLSSVAEHKFLLTALSHGRSQIRRCTQAPG